MSGRGFVGAGAVPGRSGGGAVGDAQVEALYLRAVIRVYGPWTTSPTISAGERALAVRRVRCAGDALAALQAQSPRGGSGAWKAQA